MDTFRSIELSDQEYEWDGIRFLTVKSGHLNGRGDICLFVPPPEQREQALPIYILLHGVYGSSWVWPLKGGVHRTASALMQSGQIQPAILAMPSDGLWGDGSAYRPHGSRDYAQWIVSDVPRAIATHIPEAGEQSPLCIGGLSMGGYGALMLGAKFPELFQAVSAHSAITRLEEMALFVEEDLAAYHHANWEEDVIDAVKNGRQALPPLRFDCGKDDALITGNRKLHRQLSDLGIPHDYEEFEGGHEWPYWKKQVERSLRFFNAHVGPARTGKDIIK